MPNGGVDNCNSCYFNKAKELGDKFIDQPEEREKHVDLLNHCLLRNVNITNSYWTYCDNYFHILDRDTPSVDEHPKRSIFSNGLFYEGYVRIPWDEKNEPKFNIAVFCSICNRKTENGIEIDHNGEILGFCTNRHYVEWWLTIHEDTKINIDEFRSPEVVFK